MRNLASMMMTPPMNPELTGRKMRGRERNLTSMTVTIVVTFRTCRKRDGEKCKELDVNDTNYSGDFRTYRKRGEKSMTWRNLVSIDSTITLSSTELGTRFYAGEL
jgi:hypothetical protein